MTPEERQMLSGLFDRVRNAGDGPKDREAEGFINDAMRSTPSAGYVLSQTVLVQQQALEAAAKRISDLEAQAKGGGGAPQEEGSFLGNLGRSLFGGGPSQPQQPQAPRGYDARSYERDPGYGQQPPRGYAPPPPPQGGPWAQAAAPAQGGGFLQGALQTATGVAGGVLLGNALGGMFGGHGGGGMFGGGGVAGGGFGERNETVNNYYESNPAGQHAQDVLQDQDQDQDAAQDAYDDSGSSGGDDYS